MNKIKLIFFTLLLTLFFIGAASVKTSAFDLFGGVCSGAGKNSTACQEKIKNGNENKISGPNGVIHTAANIMALVTGIAAVIMIIIGGFSYVTAGGNAEQVTTARRRIIFSLAGLVVVALAWAIVTFVTDKLIK